LSSDRFGTRERPGQSRLDSWKEIAAYLKRGVRTVQRWERTEGLPVHRLPHSKSGSIHAYPDELDEWWRERSGRLGAEEPVPEDEAAVEPEPTPAGRRPGPKALLSLAGATLLAAAVYAVSTLGRDPEAERLMLAVLPFQNLSGSDDDDYLAEGLTEEMITVLARLSPDRLGVIARTSVAPYRTQPKALTVIARELGVSHVLEGSVRRAGERVRVTAQLIEVANQSHLWAEAYDQDLSDVLDTESRIAAAVAQRLSVRLLPPVARTPAPPSREAHVAYLKGLFFWNKRSAEGLRRAIELFREAIDLDPGYATAHAAMASSYALLATAADVLDAREARTMAEASARRALELDPRLPEGHAALSVVLCRFDWNWTECERELTQALALDPNHATGHFWLGEHLLQRGRLREGEEELKKARALDPLSPAIHTHLGIAYMYGGRYGEALECVAQALEIEPRFLLAHRVKGLALLRSGRAEEGVAALRQARSLDPRSAHAAADLGYALGRSGRTTEARAVLAELEQLANERPVSSYDFAVVLAGLGDDQAALERLENAHSDRATGVRWLKVEPIFDSLRGDPRFRALIERVGLPD
jgi:TolB-like protein/Flp pilus assembly protein TadD